MNKNKLGKDIVCVDGMIIKFENGEWTKIIPVEDERYKAGYLAALEEVREKYKNWKWGMNPLDTFSASPLMKFDILSTLDDLKKKYE